MTEIPSCTVHAMPMVLKQGERGKTFWTCQLCDNESTERLRSMCESANPADHARFKALHEKREAERYWFYDYLCDGCKQRIAKAIVARATAEKGQR